MFPDKPMKVRLAESKAEWMPGGAFHHDFVYRFPRVAPFFAFDPRSMGSTVRRKGYLEGWRGNRKKISEIVLRDNTRWGADATALESARDLQEDNTCVVLAQVRPSVLGGTGSVFLKALSVLEYARRLAAVVNMRVIPMLWVVGDHNWGAVGRVMCTGRDGTIRRLCLKPDPQGCASANEISIHPGINHLLGEFEEVMGADVRESDVMESLRRAALEHETVTDAFCHFLCGIFSHRGLLLVDGSSSGVREMIAPLLQQAALRRHSVEGELAVGADRLASKGYEVPLPGGTGRCHIFMDCGRGRVQLFREGERFRDLDGTLEIGAADLAKLIQEEPHRFSSGEVLRPVAQDCVLPVLAHVVGKEEAICRAQTKGVYSLFDGAVPPVFPQVSLTFIEPRVADERDSRDIPIDALLKKSQSDQLLESILAGLGQQHIEALFQKGWNRIDEALSEIRSGLETQVPSLRHVGEANAVRMRRQMNYYDRKARQHHRRKHREVVRGFRFVRNSLRPLDGPQEDVSYLPLLVRHGRGWMAGVLDAMSSQEHLWGHYFVEWCE